VEEKRRRMIAFFEEVKRRRTECLNTGTDDEYGEEYVKMRVEKGVGDLVRWICAEVDISFELMIGVIFNYGVNAFLEEMKDPKGWVSERKNELIRNPGKAAEIRARLAEIRRLNRIP
jgi:hypothetical protein